MKRRERRSHGTATSLRLSFEGGGFEATEERGCASNLDVA